MSRAAQGILTFIVGLLVVILALKLLGFLVGLVIKLVLLAALIGVVAIIYLLVKGQLGGPRA